jgi:hypothetical protein
MLERMNLARGGAEALLRERIIEPGYHPEAGREIAMPTFRFTNSDQQARQVLSRRSSLRQLRLAMTLALSIIVLTIGVLREQPGRLNAGEQPLAGTQVQPGTPDTSSNFVAESHMALKKVHMDLVKLHGDIMGLSDSGVNYADIRVSSEGEIAAQANLVESANAKFRYAQFMREAGEIAVREYQDGIVKEEKVCALAELKLAQEDLARAQLQIEQSRERLAKITRASDGSTTALVNVWRYEYGDVVAQLQAKRAGLAIEQARSKLRVNEEYDKAVRVKQLQSDVEKLRSDELATRATRELEASKLLKFQRSRDFDKTGVLLTDPQKRLMALLDRAIPIEAKWTEQLDRIEKNGQSGEAIRREIMDLTSQLQAIIEKAQIDLASAALARLKATIQRKAKRMPSNGVSAIPSRLLAFDEPPTHLKTPTGAVANPASFVTENRRALAKLEEQFNGLGNRVLAILEASNPAQVELTKQQIAVPSAEANYENAKLTRQVAEIAIVEYEEGIFKQDEAKAMGELKLAESELSQVGDSIEYAKRRLVQLKQASRGSAADLANEYAFEDRILDSERREPIARLAVEKARSKLRILQEYTRPKHVKELQAAVETAKADELAKQARMELEKAKLKKLEEPFQNRRKPIREERILTLLDRAIPIEERLQAKLTQAETGQATGDSLRKEVADLTNEFQALIERALAEEAAADWDRLKPSIHQAAIQAGARPPK